jgi:hypothetical protein
VRTRCIVAKAARALLAEFASIKPEQALMREWLSSACRQCGELCLAPKPLARRAVSDAGA